MHCNAVLTPLQPKFNIDFLHAFAKPFLCWYIPDGHHAFILYIIYLGKPPNPVSGEVPPCTSEQRQSTIQWD